MRKPKTPLFSAGERTRRNFLAAAGAVGTGLFGGCLGGDAGGASGDETSEPGGSDATESGDDADGDWRSMELQTVRDGETFAIERLDAPVVVQSFAVWCPKCERQSNQLAGLEDTITRVGLNTDPNEDAAKVAGHAEDNGFDWRFAVTPTAMTESLIDEFGTTVTNAPSTPVIVLCGDGTTTFESGEIQSAAEVESIAGDC